MTINPSEVTKLLKEQIKNFGEKAPKELQKFLAEKYPEAEKYEELHIPNS